MIKFENPTNGRYYYLIVQRDMLNDTVLSVIFGGRLSRHYRKLVVNCESAIENEINRLTKKRLKRGYIKIT